MLLLLQALLDATDKSESTQCGEYEIKDKKKGGPYCIWQADLSWNRNNIKPVPLFPQYHSIGTKNII